MTMLDSVEATLTALELDEIDKAAGELARTYARQLDIAAAVRGQADRAVIKAIKSGDEEVIEMMQALRAKLGERDTVDRIGRALAALLVELQATPKARGAKAGPKRQAAASSGALHLVRQKAAQ